MPLAWNSSDCFESFSPLNNVVTEGVITTRSNRMKFRLTECLFVIGVPVSSNFKILWATTPKDTSWSLHNVRFLVASVSSWKRTRHGSICNCNLSCPTKRFHGTKRICQVTFNIYIVGVVSMHSSLSLHSRSIPTMTDSKPFNAEATSKPSLRVHFFSPVVHGGLHKVLLQKTRRIFVGKILLE